MVLKFQLGLCECIEFLSLDFSHRDLIGLNPVLEFDGKGNVESEYRRSKYKEKE